MAKYKFIIEVFKNIFLRLTTANFLVQSPICKIFICILILYVKACNWQVKLFKLFEIEDYGWFFEKCITSSFIRFLSYDISRDDASDSPVQSVNLVIIFWNNCCLFWEMENAIQFHSFLIRTPAKFYVFTEKHEFRVVSVSSHLKSSLVVI